MPSPHLNGKSQITPHRPGLLDGPVLRDLMEQRHEITTRLEVAESILDAVPSHRHVLQAEIEENRKLVTRAEVACRRAETVIDEHDRPLRRRKHEPEIADARRELQRQPEVIQAAQLRIDRAETKLEGVAQQAAGATKILNARKQLEVVVADVDERLAHDIKVRTRIARLDHPTAMTDTLGPRPRSSGRAAAWDVAAGRLHQHQAAFDIRDGIGDWPGRLDRSAFAASYDLVDEAIHRLRPARAMEPDVPDLGLSL